jgi:hypothetical protein
MVLEEMLHCLLLRFCKSGKLLMFDVEVDCWTAGGLLQKMSVPKYEEFRWRIRHEPADASLAWIFTNTVCG